MAKQKWPLSWLRRWDKKQEKDSFAKQLMKEYEEDPRRDDYSRTGRLYPLIEDEYE